MGDGDGHRNYFCISNSRLRPGPYELPVWRYFVCLQQRNNFDVSFRCHYNYGSIFAL